MDPAPPETATAEASAGSGSAPALTPPIVGEGVIGTSEVVAGGPRDFEGGWECGSSHYDLGSRVGKGAFAEVYAARCRGGRRAGVRVAIKIIDLDGISSDMEDIRQEVRVPTASAAGIGLSLGVVWCVACVACVGKGG